MQNHRQLPCEVVAVLHGGLTAEAARGRHSVSGISREEDPSLYEAIRGSRSHFPRRYLQHLDLEVWNAHGGAHELDAALGVEVGRALLVRIVLNRDEGAIGLRGVDERPSEVGILQIVERQAAP